MPLTDEQKHLLHELYETPYTADIVYSVGGNSVGPEAHTTSTALFVENSVRVQLQRAIVEIDQDETKVTRVGELIAKYQGWDLDPSNLDREGYSFRYKKSMRELFKRLWAYTGIAVVSGSSSGRTPLG